ncbi:MAG: type IV pilus secretin PilQ, partial [Myxococcota bacterium]
GKVSRITLALSGDVQTRVDDRSKKAWVLELTGTHVDAALEKSLDTSAYGGVVRLVSTYQASREPRVVNIVVQLQGNATQRLLRDGNAIAWEITGEAKAPALPAIAEAAEPEVATQRTPQTAGYASAAAAVARSIPAQSTASGRARRVSLNFKDADIVNVIRLIADVTGENIITSEDVKGKVTVRLRNVPWETALDTILKSKGYDKVRAHNILRIAPANQIQGERDAEIARQKSQIEIEEKVIKIVTVNYANAGEVVNQVKSLLSTRGTVQTDERTNTIIVEDVRSNIDRLVELVRRLDKQTPQVLIEARIVEASTNFSQDLGVQWGGQAQATAASGNPTGLSFPGDIIATGANTGGVTSGVTTPGNYAVNLPAAITTGGAIGLVFGSAGGSQLLQLRLAALEGRGSGRIISSPRVATLDNRTAKISQGVDIPITVTSAAGANTRFVPANLELEVTPHVTNDGAILMRIHATRNEPNFARTGAFGDPTIERREAQTEVLVNDGDTTVIGGIYTRNTTRQYSQVPVLSQIPLLGWLFKNRTDRDNKSELLIFISPKIVNRSESTVSGGDTMSGG